MERNYDMKVLVINLEQDVSRRDNILRQLDLLDIETEIVTGINGKKLSDFELSMHYSDNKAQWREARSLSSAEIGCALSHIKCYQTIIRKNYDFALILEDDAVLPSNLPPILSEIEARLSADDPIVVLLSEANTESGSTQILHGNYKLAKFRSGYYGSSYIVTHLASQRLVNELYPVAHVPDPWNRMSRFGIVNFSVVRPAVISQDQRQFGSSTTEGIKELFNGDRFGMHKYKLRRARNIVWDAVSVFGRHFRAKRENSSIVVQADRLLD